MQRPVSFQYSCRKLRDQAFASGVRSVIPYPANQCRGEKKLLRVDRYFRAHGPAFERRLYKQRSAVERINSRLKEQLSLTRHRAKGLKNSIIRGYCQVTQHATMLVLGKGLSAHK